jgi:hypothetical protein
MSQDAVRFLDTLEPHALASELHAWRGSHPRLGVFALVAEGDRSRVPLLQSVCRDVGVPLLGGIFPALVVDARFSSVGTWLLRVDELSYAELHPDLPGDSASLPGIAAGLVDAILPHVTSADATLLLLFDGMYPRIASLLDELYLRLGNRVSYVGANAGSETFRPTPCLFDRTRVAGGGVAALVLNGHRGAVLEHGYGVPQKMITASATEGNRVITIDWRPAFEVYREVAREQYGVEVDRENFYRYAVRFPFGIVRGDGEVVVRIPVALEADGSLFCVGEVPANSLLTLLRAPAVDSRLTVDTLLAGLAERGGPEGQELLLFYCAGRRLYLGDEQARAELGDFKARSRARRVCGALSLGEIGSPEPAAYPAFHNATLLASGWGGT